METNLRWFIDDFTLTPQYFASSLSVNCHDSQFHRASSLSVNWHDGQFHRLPTISSTSVDGETDCRDSLLTNSMQNIRE